MKLKKVLIEVGIFSLAAILTIVQSIIIGLYLNGHKNILMFILYLIVIFPIISSWVRVFTKLFTKNKETV